MKSAFDCSHVKSVTAWALFHDAADKEQQERHPYGAPAAVRLWAGKVVANFSDNPAGSVCTVTIVAWHGPLAKMREAWEAAKPGRRDAPNPMTARAGGGGYCKFSAAFYFAVRVVDPDIRGVSGAGESAVKAYLASRGYTVVEVV